LTLHILITGGAGFIGAHLARRLLGEGARIDLIDDFSRGRLDAELTALAEQPAVRCLERDLLAPGSLEDLGEDYDLVFHLAAIVGVANVMKQPLAVLRRNVELLLGMLDFAARQKRLRRLVFASTSEVHAGSLLHLDLPIPTPETAPVALPDLAQSRSSYLLSKLYGEALCHHAGLPVTVIRPYNIYGPRMGMAHVIPELLQRAERTPDGGAMTVYSTRHRRAFCYVSDAVELIARLALAEDALGGVFNVGNQGEEVAVGQLAELIVAAVGRSVAIEAGPDTPGSPARRCPDMTRTGAVTGYEARVSLPEGLRRTYDWYREQVFQPAGVAAQ
jgi:nucleoside-diphosphate-sugar epimerase